MPPGSISSFREDFSGRRRAIVYVWSDKLPVGTVIANAYTDRVAVIAVESGNRFAGIWRTRAAIMLPTTVATFMTSRTDPVAIAFMTDTDNTGSQAVAWYGDIFFSR